LAADFDRGLSFSFLPAFSTFSILPLAGATFFSSLAAFFSYGSLTTFLPLAGLIDFEALLDESRFNLFFELIFDRILNF
jgi:hypothetical protein